MLMKIKSKIIILTVLLAGSLMITPALASTTQAGYQTKSLSKNLETITIEFIDCTGVLPVKKEITLSKTEWKSVTEELKNKTKKQIMKYSDHYKIEYQSVSPLTIPSSAHSVPYRSLWKMKMAPP